MTYPHLPLIFLLVAGSTLVAVLAGGCLGGGPAPDDSTVRTIPPARASALIEEMGSSPGFVIVDVRRPDEFAGGHIPGAVNINSAGFSEHLQDLDPDGTYVICCQRGGRSAGVRELMREAGFGEVYEIEGGMNAWQAAGLPVVTD
jgi:rhodanese-related sulfurtransferase